MTEQGERREPVVTGLADIDPVGPLGLGLVVVVVAAKVDAIFDMLRNRD